MFVIALGILLSIVLLFVVFYLIAKYIEHKENNNYEKEIKKNREKELDKDWEYLEALERGDKNAKLGKEYYFKEKNKRIKF